MTLFPTITASVLTLIPYSPTSYLIRYSTEPHFGSKNFAKVTLTLNWLTPNYEKMETMHVLFLNSCLQAHWPNHCALALQIQKQNGCEPDLKVMHIKKKNKTWVMGTCFWKSWSSITNKHLWRQMRHSNYMHQCKSSATSNWTSLSAKQKGYLIWSKFMERLVDTTSSKHSTILIIHYILISISKKAKPITLKYRT